jgi:hypothetical protein
MTRGGKRALALAMTAVVALLGACSDDGSDDASGDGRSGDIRVLSYNVAGLPQEVSSENPKDHIPLISPRLEPYDLVLTQEDFDWWIPLLDTWDFANYHNRLRAEVTHEHRSPQHPGPEAAGVDLAPRPTMAVGDGLGLLSRYPIDERARIAWHGCFGGLDTSDGGAGDCLAMKGFSRTVVTLAPGVEVDVYNLHGEAGGTEADQVLQRDDYDQLATYIDEHSRGRAIILGGDTNLHTEPDHPDAEGLADTRIWDRFLRRTGIVDSCAALECPQSGRIDKIAFRSNDRVTLTPTRHRFVASDFRAPGGEDLSDHEPLEVVFRWNAT